MPPSASGELVFLYARLRLHWGFTVRQPGASAAQLAYPLPPPTTVVGAFMNPLARLLGIGEATPPRSMKGVVGNLAMECGVRSALAAGAALAPDSPVGAAVFEEPSRILGGPFKGGGSYSRAVKQPPPIAVQEVLPVQAAGSASAPHAVMVIAAVIDSRRLSTCLRASVSIEDFARAAALVYRVGSREGLVSLEDSWAGPARAVGGAGYRFESTLYQPRRCAALVMGVASPLVMLGVPGYSEEEYYYPAPGSSIVVRPAARPLPLFEARSGCTVYAPEDGELAGLGAMLAGLPAIR